MKIHALLQPIKTADRRHLWLAACFAVICLMALFLRYKLIADQTFDYTHFLKPWYENLSHNGIKAFGKGFANYNTPYLILLYLSTLLPVGELAAVKLLSMSFDIVLAASVALIVGHFRPLGYAKYVAFATILYLPTVWMNSGLWGQCDAMYTSFVMLAFYFCLKDRSNLAWILWGVAFAFKLQGIFFLPFLIFFSFYRKWKWYVPAFAIITAVLLTIFPLFFGRSFGNVFGVYLGQVATPTAYRAILAWYSATFYQFMPNELYPYLKTGGVMLGGAVAVATISLAFLGKRYTKETMVVIAALSLLAIPYFLPQIHERYMFTAEIMLVVVAFVVPRFVWMAIGMQIVSITTYNSYFTGGNGQPQISYPVLSLIVLAILYYLTKYLAPAISQPLPLPVLVEPATRDAALRRVTADSRRVTKARKP